MKNNVVYVGDKVWNRTLQCDVTILSEVNVDGTVCIDTPYGKLYCFPHDLVIKQEREVAYGGKAKKS